MVRKMAIVLITLIIAAVSGCAGRGLASPEGAAQTALENWARTSNTPFKDASFNTLNNDGTFATVRITVKLRQSPETDWQEYQADVQCRLVGSQWQAPGYLQFQLSQAEQRKQAAATATAEATRVSAIATAEVWIAKATSAAEASKPYFIRTLSGHTGAVWSVVFFPDGKTLAAGCNDYTVKLWDIASGQELRTIVGTGATIALSPDGKILAGASNDNTVKLWNIASGQLVRTLSSHTKPVVNVAFSPNGNTLASASNDNTVKLWNVNSGQVTRTLDGQFEPQAVAFSLDSKTLVSASADKTIRLWDVNSGQLVRTLSGHTDVVSGVAYSPDGKTLASMSYDGTIKLWDVTKGQIVRTLSGGWGRWPSPQMEQS